ncbi:hypothetical protein M422DRAFT_56407 [Sphaerobolus stellatus SS14]|uniref:Uncharacterized protein n=1 Tax=Sphaerobolus stellatus (strain SS14) TaxID=990650 RepID=A0A0C9TRD9_SPHS4|nr:hypothetical protein M422DRAFT_56407 [Sphaerobolus stellatus SS14]
MIRAIYFTSALIAAPTVLAQDSGIIGGITSAAGAVGSAATSIGGDVTSAGGTVSFGVTSVGGNIMSALGRVASGTTSVGGDITSVADSVAGDATFTGSPEPSNPRPSTVVSGMPVLTSNGGEGITIPVSDGPTIAVVNYSGGVTVLTSKGNEAITIPIPASVSSAAASHAASFDQAVTSVGPAVTTGSGSDSNNAAISSSDGSHAGLVTVVAMTVLTSKGSEAITIPASVSSAAASHATSFYQSATSVGPAVTTGSGSDSNNAAISLSGGSLAGLVTVVASITLGALVVA